jgi:predicted alpha/beta hydrolase family esterase
MVSQAPVLVLPGFGGSGPDHWQSIWERRNPCYRRVEQRDWDAPDLVEWLDALERAVTTCERPPVLVAHSLACALVAHFAGNRGLPLAAALLVSPADVDEISTFYSELESFAPMPLTPLPFPSIVVASDNDMYVLVDRAEAFARAWGSRLVMLEGAGHINAESGLGDWPRGQALLAELLGLPQVERRRP